MFLFRSTAPVQIRHLLESLNASNSDSVFQELCEYVSYGVEGSILLLKTILDHLNVYGRDLKNVQIDPVFASLFKYILNEPNCSTVFCESLKSISVSEGFLDNLCNALHMTASEKIGLGLALSDSENLGIKMCGKNFCMSQITELFAHHMSMDSAEQIQQMLMFLNRSESLSKHVDAFMQMLSLVQLNNDGQFILAPLLTDEVYEANFFGDLNFLNEGDEDDFDVLLAEMEKEMSMADIMKELGYGCTANVSQCKEIVSLFSPLDEISVARILGTVSRTYSGLEENHTSLSTFHSALGSSSVLDVPTLNSWNADVLIESIKQLAPGINWGIVFENLDHEGFYIPNEAAFMFFMSIYKHVCQDPFPLHAVCGSVWKNAEGQLSFLKHSVSVPPEVFTFTHSLRKLVYTDAVDGHKFQLGALKHVWSSLDLLEVLCQLGERGHANAVRSILEYPLKHCPEVLLLGMVHINTAYNLIRNEVCSAVFPLIMKNATGGNKLILQLWHVNPAVVLWEFIDVLNADPESIIRVLDTCQELKILLQVMDMIPSHFGIRLAALASRKEFIDLEEWLVSNLTAYRDAFYEECLVFLKEVQLAVQEVSSNHFQPSGLLWNIYSESSSTFLKVLQSNTGLLSTGHLSEEVEKLNVAYLHANSRTRNGGGADSSSTDGFAADIEAEANSYFHQMFSGQLSVEAIIQMLARFKESPDKREKSIFECMIANLFEEYKFFSKYPDMQLKIAAVLFGSLIKHQLVTHLTLGIALRTVLDALRKPADSKMFVFGTKALEQFVDRMIEWPQYCNHLLQISHLRATNSDLAAYIERALARITAPHNESDTFHSATGDQHGPNQVSATSMEMLSSSFHLMGSGSSQNSQRQQNSLDERKPSATQSNYSKSALPAGIQLGPDAPGIQKAQTNSNASATQSSPGFVRPARSITSARFGSALNIETLVAAAERRETPIEAPASESQDKISFIINNLSLANVETKAKEFMEILKEQYYPWFAQYMVMKRASIEPNFHDLYLKFLDKVNSRPLNKEIIQATYENCKVLLGSELIKSSSEERSLLKNLGSWLGKITIGRNQVLRAREIDPKSLIIEAYEKGLMIAVIPFTSKILEPCQSSVAYQPPNPWTMGILGLLVEIYAMPNLKMNLKFDIEVLFKNLGVDLKDVTPTSLLKDRVRELEGNPDFSNKDIASSQQIVGEVKPSLISSLNQVELPLEVAGPAHPVGHSRIISQYAPAPLHLSSGTLTEDEKLAALGLSDQLPSAQGLLPGQSPFSINQVSLAAPASNIDQQVIVNPKLQHLGLHIHFQSVLPIAMDRAIKEVVAGIVQRSVSIASQTTKELVLKDYAMETDETRIRNAAHLMVACLSGSLAHVTCKEQLRGALSSQLRNSFQGSSIGNEILEQAVQLVTNDNLDLGCALIEQAATEKAIQTIDGEIAQQLSIRRKHREGAGVYFDAGLYAQNHMGVLPEALRPKPGRLSISQQRVYEDFVRLPWQNQSSQSTSTLSVGLSTSPTSGGISRGYASTSGQISSGIYSSIAVNSGLGSVTQSLDIASEDIDSSLGQIHSVSSAHSALGDAASPHNIDNENNVSSFPSISTELHTVEPTSIVKESATAVQQLNQTSASERLGNSVPEPLLTTGEALDKYQIVAEKLESLLAGDVKDAEIQVAVAEVPTIVLRCISRDEAALAVAQKAFKALYENASNSAHVSAHLAILAAIRDVSKLVVKELTSWVIYSEEDRKFNKDITVGLIQSELLNLAEYNVHMAKLLDAGRNKAATDFAISLIQTLVVSDFRVMSELQNLVDALAKVAARPGSPESLQQLVEIAKNPAANTTALTGVTLGKEDNARQTRDKKVAVLPTSSGRDDYSVGLESIELDPGSFRQQVAMLFADWYRLCEHPVSNDAAVAHFVLQLHQSGFLKGDDTSDRFFGLLTDVTVAHCLSTDAINAVPSQSQQGQSISFLAIDIYAKLVYSILKFCPVEQGSSKLFLLPKVLTVTVKYIQKDAEERKTSFNPRPYFRLFINWLLDLCSVDPVFDGANFQILTGFANAFHALQPLKIPGFSFAWLELVSHRSFMPKLLIGNAQKGWPYFQRLLVDMLQFMEPFLRNAELVEPVHFLYKGTLRVLLVLLHDFPEFLCDYHFSFCDVIPPSCIQMRNIILSAFPRNMRLPDPSTPNLKIDLLAEIRQSPRMLTEFDAALKAKQMKNDVDEYLKTKQQLIELLQKQPGSPLVAELQQKLQASPFLTELKQKILLSPNEASRAGTRYNVPLINSLVLYVGSHQAIYMLQLQARTPPNQQSMASNVPLASFIVGPGLDIFQALITDMDSEGRYLFLNAIVNQLRYPNTQTHYFSFMLLYLFAESSQEMFQEQITRVLLERLIVNRPHPWGLLITFIELIKNTRYNFWSRSFTRCAPEIEKLFESVSRSCGGTKSVEDSVVSGGIPDNLH